MADLRIVDAPLLSTVKGTEKIPTGGEGNFSVSVNQVADFAKLKWFLATEEYVDNAVGNVQAVLNLHKNNSSNPHSVTKVQVGLGNVDNIADLDKPVSNATQSAIITANSGKADKSYVDTQNNLKADKATVEASLLLKADKVDLIASKIASDGGQTQQVINNFGGAKWYAKVGGYELGATVKLANGDIVKSTIADNTANPNVDMMGWVLVNSDGQIKTWSGRTQEQKNKDSIDPRDYGATAYESMGYSQATTTAINSTVAFNQFEQQIKGQPIDLKGMYYVVDSIRNANKYYNGYFVVGGLIQKQEQIFARNMRWMRGTGEGYCYAEVQVRNAGNRGVGYIQSIAYNPIDDTIWTLSHTVQDRPNPQGVIMRYQLEAKITTFTDIVSTFSNTIGHQGLGIQYVDGIQKLWIGIHEDNVKAGTHLMRATPPSDEGDISDIEYFKVFDNSEGNLSAKSHLSPSVSPYQDLLCCTQMNKDQKQYFIKVFDLNTFTDPNKDYTNSYVSKFYLTNLHDGANLALQSVVTDGSYVYVLMGYNYLQVYTLAGQLVDVIEHKVGYERSQNLIDANGTPVSLAYYEPESLLFVPTNDGYTLAMSIIMGYTGSWTYHTDVRRNYIYTSIPVKTVRNNASYSVKKPTVISNQPVDIAVPYVKGFNVSYQANGYAVNEYRTALQVNPNNMLLNNHEASEATGRKVGMWVRITGTADRVLTEFSTSNRGASSGATISLYDNTDTVAGGILGLSAGNVTGTQQSITITPQGVISPTNDMTFGTTARILNRIYTKAIYHTATVFMTWGNGSPEGVLAAGVGSKFIDTGEGDEYIKKTGTGNTGWVAK